MVSATYFQMFQQKKKAYGKNVNKLVKQVKAVNYSFSFSLGLKLWKIKI